MKHGPERHLPLRASQPVGEIEVFGFLVTFDHALARRIKHSSCATSNVTENEIAVAQDILRTRDHCVPPLSPEVVNCIRAELARSLFYVGRSLDAQLLLRQAEAAIDELGEQAPAQCPNSVAHLVTAYFALGMLEDAERYGRGQAARAVLQAYAPTDSTGQAPAMSVLTALVQVKRFTCGPDTAVEWLVREVKDLGLATRLSDADKWLGNLFCHVLSIASERRDLRSDAARSLAAAVGMFLKKGNTYATTQHGLMTVSDILHSLASAVLRDRSILDGPTLAWLSRVCLAYEQLLYSLPSGQTRYIRLWHWWLAQLASASGVFHACVNPNAVADRLRVGALSCAVYNKYALTLPMHRRATVCHQNAVICDMAGVSPVQHVRAFVDTVLSWRGRLAKFGLRSGLRRSVAWQSEQVLEVARRWTQRATQEEAAAAGEALAIAVEGLGPARWLHERIAVNLGSDRNEALLTEIGAAQSSSVLQGVGRIIQIAPAGEDLWLIHTPMERGGGTRTLLPHHVAGGARRLRQLYHDRIGEKLPQINEALSAAAKARDRKGYVEHRGRLHAWVRRLGAEIGDIVRDGLVPFVDSGDEDILIACYDPRLLALPWALVEVERKPLIERAKSLTFNMSVGAAAAIGVQQRDGSGNAGFDMAAICHDGGVPRLRWERMFVDDGGQPAGLSLIAQNHNLTFRTFGVGHGFDDDVADIATLRAYAGEYESNLLLVAGHGDPHKGVRLADHQHWSPSAAADGSWRLRKTECAILPSCRLGEMRWDNSGKEGGADPNVSEIVGFTAGLCIAGIPRVIACPWVVYDLPICRLIPMIVGKALDKRAKGEPHYWARAVRDVVVDGLKTPIRGVGTYDLANLMLFGAP